MALKDSLYRPPNACVVCQARPQVPGSPFCGMCLAGRVLDPLERSALLRTPDDPDLSWMSENSRQVFEPPELDARVGIPGAAPDYDGSEPEQTNVLRQAADRAAEQEQLLRQQRVTSRDALLTAMRNLEAVPMPPPAITYQVYESSEEFGARMQAEENRSEEPRPEPKPPEVIVHRPGPSGKREPREL